MRDKIIIIMYNIIISFMKGAISMKKTKRFLSGLLVALCIFSICTVPAFAFVDTDDIQTHHEVLGIADEIWMIGPVIPRGPTCSLINMVPAQEVQMAHCIGISMQ